MKLSTTQMFSKNVSESLSSPTNDYTGVSKLPIKMLMCWKVNYFTLTRERYFQHSKIQIYRTLNTPYLPTVSQPSTSKMYSFANLVPRAFSHFLGRKIKAVGTRRIPLPTQSFSLSISWPTLIRLTSKKLPYNG